jgi:hypothetical protein
VQYQIYDRSFGTVARVTPLQLTSSWEKAVQFTKLNESVKLGFVIRQYPWIRHDPSMAEIHFLGRVHLSFQCLQDRSQLTHAQSINGFISSAHGN